jgi:dolichol-phosphate mannosyltransferase
MENETVSVVLPCYNEKENILSLIKAISLELEAYEFEIVVVDDNSPDGTFDLVHTSGLPRTIAYKRTSSPSLAESIRHGIEHSSGNIVVVMDSDFNHQPECLPVLLANMKFFDCVSASRFVYGGDMGNKFRHISSWLFNIFNRILTRTFITDSLFGYFAIKRDVLEGVDFDKVFWGYGDYCIRLMYYLQKEGVSILQIPGVLGQRLGGQGNTEMFKTLRQYTIEVLKLALLPKEEQRKKSEL